MSINTCRFCKTSAEHGWLVKYGTRHYAHPTCYLDAGKKVSELSDWQQSQFDRKLQDWKQLLQQRGFK
jgi:hypothetical protein